MKYVYLISSALSLLLTLTACGASQQAIKSAKEFTKSPVEAEAVKVNERIAKSYSGPKIRVAVGELSLIHI